LLTFQELQQLNIAYVRIQKMHRFLRDNPTDDIKQRNNCVDRLRKIATTLSKIAIKNDCDDYFCDWLAPKHSCNIGKDWGTSLFFPHLPGLVAVCPVCDRKFSWCGDGLMQVPEWKKDPYGGDIIDFEHPWLVKQHANGRWNDERCGMQNVSISYHFGYEIGIVPFVSFEELMELIKSKDPEQFLRQMLQEGK